MNNRIKVIDLCIEPPMSLNLDGLSTDIDNNCFVVSFLSLFLQEWELKKIATIFELINRPDKYQEKTAIAVRGKSFSFKFRATREEINTLKRSGLAQFRSTEVLDFLTNDEFSDFMDSKIRGKKAS